MRCAGEQGGGGARAFVEVGTRGGFGEREKKTPATRNVRLLLSLSLARSLSLTPNAKKKEPNTSKLGQRSPRPLRSFSRQPPSLNRGRRKRSRRPSGWKSISPSDNGKRPPSEMRFFGAKKKALASSPSVSRFAVPLLLSSESLKRKIRKSRCALRVGPLVSPPHPPPKKTQITHLAGAQILGLGLGEHHGLDGALR